MIVGEEHCGPGGCKLRIAGVSKVFDGRRGKVVALEGINLNIRSHLGHPGKRRLLGFPGISVQGRQPPVCRAQKAPGPHQGSPRS
jgi:hypothetical protein